jgi:hypothetical protein
VLHDDDTTRLSDEEQLRALVDIRLHQQALIGAIDWPLTGLTSQQAQFDYAFDIGERLAIEWRGGNAPQRLVGRGSDAHGLRELVRLSPAPPAIALGLYSGFCLRLVCDERFDVCRDPHHLYHSNREIDF